MKKLIYTFGILALLAGAGCAKVDYSCYWHFKIANQTESNIVVVSSFSFDETIKPGETFEISRIMAHCDKNTRPGDIFTEDEVMQISHFSDQTIKIKLNKHLLSDTLWTRKYWDFAEKEYQATYTLTITDELLENLFTESNPL